MVAFGGVCETYADDEALVGAVLFELLDFTRRVRITDLGELGDDRAPAALENASIAVRRIVT